MRAVRRLVNHSSSGCTVFNRCCIRGFVRRRLVNLCRRIAAFGRRGGGCCQSLTLHLLVCNRRNSAWARRRCRAGRFVATPMLLHLLLLAALFPGSYVGLCGRDQTVKFLSRLKLLLVDGRHDFGIVLRGCAALQKWLKLMTQKMEELLHIPGILAHGIHGVVLRLCFRKHLCVVALHLCKHLLGNLKHGGLAKARAQLTWQVETRCRARQESLHRCNIYLQRDATPRRLPFCPKAKERVEVRTLRVILVEDREDQANKVLVHDLVLRLSVQVNMTWQIRNVRMGMIPAYHPCCASHALGQPLRCGGCHAQLLR
mmetsp:Transcript_74078/g.176429  ORF Transcript_74078/g.176429 Transcript_74078/m.176429 type:complete len:314 (-) Transcript_74078:246-1187(-)